MSKKVNKSVDKDFFSWYNLGVIKKERGKYMENTIKKLREEFGNDVRFEKAIHLHDEVGYNYSNEYTISYKGVIVGSELVDYDFIRENIIRINNNQY